MSGRVCQSMPFFCRIFHHRGDYIKFLPSRPHFFFFLHRSIQSHSTSSRSIIYCRKAAIQASPSGPFEIMRVLSPISTSHLFTIYDPFVVPKLFCVHVTLCCAMFVWLIHLCYTPLQVIFSLFNAVTCVGRRDCRSPRRTKCYTVQCSVQWSEGRAVMLYDRHKVKLCF